MVLPDISSKISFLTHSDTTSYPNADRLINMNTWYQNIFTIILRSHDDWSYDDSNRTDYPILAQNLVASQQDYILPTSAIQIKRLEVTYDGTNWRRARAFDIGSRDAATDVNSLGDFNTNTPYYDLQYGSIFLYPIPSANVSTGLKLWVERGPLEFTLANLTDSNFSPGFDAQFHNILAWGPSYDYAVANNLPNRDVLKGRIDELMNNLAIHYSSKDKDVVYSLQGNYENFK